MSNGLIVSVSGIRGIVGTDLTPEVACAFACSLGTFAGGGHVAVGRDGRPSGTMLRHAVIAGLTAAGCNVIDLGIVPTPTLGLAVRRLQAAGGVQITASHNPAAWNGLKLFGPDGSVLSAADGRHVQELFERRAFRLAGWQAIGGAVDEINADTWHRDRVLELIDAAPIRAAKQRVFLDANGGAGGPLGRALLDALGIETVCHGCDASGAFAHEPEPIEANLQSVCPLVPRHRASVGFVLDPDADRLALIDETGHYLGEELTLALAVLRRLHEGAKGPVVINMSTSRQVEDLAAQFGVRCHRSAVGEANVAQRMREVGASIGGEGNGGVIDPRVGYVRDPFIGMGLILALLAESGLPLSRLAAGLPTYAIVKNKVSIDRARLPALFASLESRWPEARFDRLDGLRLEWPDRWVHVRPSNTEPIVRIIAEARDTEGARRLCEVVGVMLKC